MVDAIVDIGIDVVSVLVFIIEAFVVVGAVVVAQRRAHALQQRGRGFDSPRVLGFFLLLSSVMCPLTGPSRRCSMTVFLLNLNECLVVQLGAKQA